MCSKIATKFAKNNTWNICKKTNFPSLGNTDQVFFSNRTSKPVGKIFRVMIFKIQIHFYKIFHKKNCILSCDHETTFFKKILVRKTSYIFDKNLHLTLYECIID